MCFARTSHAVIPWEGVYRNHRSNLNSPVSIASKHLHSRRRMCAEASCLTTVGLIGGRSSASTAECALPAPVGGKTLHKQRVPGSRKELPQRLDARRHQAQLPRRAEKIKGVRAAARLRRSNVDQCSVASYQTPQLAECFDQIVEFALLYDHGS